MHPALEFLPPWADPWPGKAILRNLPDTAYHNTKSIVSKSALDIFARTPAHYHATLDAPPRIATEPMKIGSAFHVLTLEPDLFNQKVIIQPDFGPMQSSTNRKIRDAWIKDEAAGRTIIKEDDFTLIQHMANAVRRHPAARKLMRDGEAEVTALWTDSETGLPCKCRADWLAQMHGVYIDLKSALDASPHYFARAAADQRYHVQDAFYSCGFGENNAHIDHFVFIAVEKEPPYAVGVYQLDETAKLKGEELYMDELRRLRDCINSDVWPAYGDGVQDLALPFWATRTESV
jgi:hypothetical protein